MVALLAAVVVFSGSLSAQNNGQQEGGSGIQISPTRNELTVQQGESKGFKINVKNITPGVLTARAFVNDFESDNETGAPQIITDAKRKSDYSIKPFLKGLSDIELQPGETKEVALTIDMPLTQAPGAYFGAVRFAAIPKGSEQSTNDSGKQIALTASVASLVLIQVPGDVTEGMTLNSLTLQEADETGKVLKSGTFWTTPPNQLATRITNTGNSFVQPFGKVVINKGGKEVYSYEFNLKTNRGNVLPKSSRTFTDPIKNIGGFGKYEVTSSLSFKQGGEVFIIKQGFWVIPIWAFIVLAVAIVALIAGIFFLRRRMNNSKS